MKCDCGYMHWNGGICETPRNCPKRGEFKSILERCEYYTRGNTTDDKAHIVNLLVRVVKETERRLKALEERK